MDEIDGNVEGDNGGDDIFFNLGFNFERCSYGENEDL